MLVVSIDFVLDSSCPLRVEELVVDAPCGLPLLEPYGFIFSDVWKEVFIAPFF